MSVSCGVCDRVEGADARQGPAVGGTPCHANAQTLREQAPHSPNPSSNRPSLGPGTGSDRREPPAASAGRPRPRAAPRERHRRQPSAAATRRVLRGRTSRAARASPGRSCCELLLHCVERDESSRSAAAARSESSAYLPSAPAAAEAERRYPSAHGSRLFRRAGGRLTSCEWPRMRARRMAPKRHAHRAT